jgi:antitoxin ParD1/3/4
MSNVEKISISLPKEMVASMKEVVASGTYASTSEIMRDALRVWQEKQLRIQEQMAKLRQMLHDSLESGPPVPFNPGETKRRGRERLAAMLKKSA